MHFEGIFDSPIFTNVESLIDTFTWPIMGDCGEFRNTEIARLASHYKILLETNINRTEKISEEWLTLKTYVIPMIKNCQETKTRYHKIWQTDLQNTELKDEC